MRGGGILSSGSECLGETYVYTSDGEHTASVYIDIVRMLRRLVPGGQYIISQPWELVITDLEVRMIRAAISMPGQFCPILDNLIM